MSSWSSPECSPPCHGGDHGFKSHRGRLGQVVEPADTRRSDRRAFGHGSSTLPLVTAVLPLPSGEGLGKWQLAGVPPSGGTISGARWKPELQRWFRIFKNPDGETDDHASVRTRRSGFESWSGYCFGVLGRLFSNGRSRFEAWPKRCVRGVVAGTRRRDRRGGGFNSPRTPLKQGIGNRE